VIRLSISAFWSSERMPVIVCTWTKGIHHPIEIE
jgi:hypothetical protein